MRISKERLEILNPKNRVTLDADKTPAVHATPLNHVGHWSDDIRTMLNERVPHLQVGHEVQHHHAHRGLLSALLGLLLM